ncbi:MAG: hypothetical protein A3I92_01765 [Candidatus Yanofskybacteria bacterium RIFCSPLOWO2_02_FULL_43_10b]|nr:MAG: hypothetical protein A3I92_01765 [Candidatus Yanofskybacteria bacterium RIFCSPLOWO2_02_FULL_43_10b]
MHKFFIKWITNFFNVSKEKFKIHLQLYENMDIEKEIKFWQNELGLKRNQVYKPFVRKLTKASFSYQESFRHGTCQTIVSGSETRQEVMAAIKAYLDVCIEGV